ncbi:hypothetical protein QJ527_07900 [Enterococcus mundtii]|uniref:hypothetical protein n=1 Tax=Enterococcus TaxID=1350 RepID=UPI00044C68C2|nr:hypothetical protein [Enterococcus mundtii]EYT96092.1 hypothetical protein AK89_05410 [Enterococcus mundtii CRL35]MDK4211466.1 hypothetical protein [Enterococcus mundtii]MDO7878818.1 hypothetical protein [Enterococcus mundtii]MEC3941655.1 hypothetical protein [Enterococcus mundtii]
MVRSIGRGADLPDCVRMTVINGNMKVSKKTIRELRTVGVDAAVSFGELNTGAFWQVSHDEDMLYDAYMKVV